ncbi:hypothetical protein Zm00014a_035026 [Zea mays]|uniref:Pyrophosphate--fructose 6-phosphate 1-phosphotransferase subunit alpha n=1 Tax=Zea mays TaxID=4577 RepID=A0A3L6G662_MAIZE|nr:hypothetical protein Zm00014a_035026 [Zea mays]PWZ44062.1 hypothetical protein Zm00014a_035026 [Zea mays]PWZ44063.1 Pyrophosphate--fructose 6-phosphate 1-phosphotransferase subunit alpha [Zea mays]PWZ44064.1 hypothetical protein Zm00014a_035026 [Zea mays]
MLETNPILNKVGSKSKPPAVIAAPAPKKAAEESGSGGLSLGGFFSRPKKGGDANGDIKGFTARRLFTQDQALKLVICILWNSRQMHILPEYRVSIGEGRVVVHPDGLINWIRCVDQAGHQGMEPKDHHTIHPEFPTKAFKARKVYYLNEAKRDELLQFAQSAISGQKINADIARLDNEITQLQHQINSMDALHATSIVNQNKKAQTATEIETEKLLAQLVETEMNKRLKEDTYKGKKFNAICHFLGYQARGALPSKFDCDYAYVLGHVCYHIIVAGLNG